MSSRPRQKHDPAISPMAERVWRQEARLHDMLDYLGIPAAVAARSRGGIDFERAADICLGCWEPACEKLLSDPPSPSEGPPDFCPNWPLLASWLEQINQRK